MVAAVFLANRLRATSAAAAQPNSRIIGGAGTGCGPPLDPPPLLPWPPLLLQPPFDDQPPDEPQPFDDEPLLDEP